MAIVKAPLLSMSARGQIGKALVFMGWKGIDDVRQHVVPANPQTAAQTTQRDLMTAVVRAWRNYFTEQAMRTAWNVTAGVMSRTLSGFNAFVSNAVQVAESDPAASFASSGVAAALNKATFVVKNLDDGAQGDEAGNFEIWSGDKPSSLLLVGTAAIAAGTVTSADLGDTGDVKYVKIRKGGYDRSGICKITLIA